MMLQRLLSIAREEDRLVNLGSSHMPQREGREGLTKARIA